MSMCGVFVWLCVRGCACVCAYVCGWVHVFLYVCVRTASSIRMLHAIVNEDGNVWVRRGDQWQLVGTTMLNMF